MLQHRRHAEVALALKQTFETVVHTHLYQRSEIDVHVQILQSDGGTVVADIADLPALTHNDRHPGRCCAQAN